jgi:outer membrane protein assembly factor BamB
VYGFSSSILTAMKLQTGEVAWRDRSVGKGSVTYAEGKLYALSEDGVVGLIDAAPDRYRERSRFEISRGSYPTWTPPVIADGKLYLREQDNLYCYNIKR